MSGFHPALYFLYFLCRVRISRLSDSHFIGVQGKRAAKLIRLSGKRSFSVHLLLSFFDCLKKINIHFRVARDNICHGSPQAYSDWACRVNRAKLTQISQGRPGTLWRGMRLFSSRFRQGRGLLLAHLSHTETDEKWKVKGILFRNGWFAVVNTPFKRHRGLSGRGR